MEEVLDGDVVLPHVLLYPTEDILSQQEQMIVTCFFGITRLFGDIQSVLYSLWEEWIQLGSGFRVQGFFKGYESLSRVETSTQKYFEHARRAFSISFPIKPAQPSGVISTCLLKTSTKSSVVKAMGLDASPRPA